MDFGAVFLSLFIIAGVVVVSVIVFIRIRDMKKTYDSEINQIVTGVNAGMSNAAAFDKQQQDELAALRASLSNNAVTFDSNLNAYKSAMTQSIDTQTFKASTIYAANGLIVGPSNNPAITFSNSALDVPMSLNVNNVAVLGASNTLVASTGSTGSTFGVAAPAAGQVKFYGPDAVSGASVSMGFARADGTYDDVVSSIKGPTGMTTNIKGAAIIDSVSASNITSEGDVVVQSGKLCIQTSCLDKTTMDKLIASANAAPVTAPTIP